MTEIDEPKLIKIDDWVFRVKEGQSTKQIKLMLLLHGYLGNENVMWILTNPLPASYTFLAPRAPLQMGENQFSWHKLGMRWPDLDIYQQLIADLLHRIDSWSAKMNIPSPKLDIMGFSQGAVVAYAMALLYPERIGRIAALAGFIPWSWKSHLQPEVLKDRKFFVAHGTRDLTVPIIRAHQAVSWLKKSGADVTFCESDIEHKLSADCFKGLGKFFTDNGLSPADESDDS